MSKHKRRRGGNPSSVASGWPEVFPDAACRGLASAHGDNAGAEALLRAFLAERNGDRTAAHFWIVVYGRLISAVS